MGCGRRATAEGFTIPTKKAGTPLGETETHIRQPMWDEIIRKRRNIVSTLNIYTLEFCSSDTRPWPVSCSSQGRSSGTLAPPLVCDSRGHPRVRFPHLQWIRQARFCSAPTPADVHHNSSCRPRCWLRWRKSEMWAWRGWALGSWRLPNSSCRRASPGAGLHSSIMHWRFLVSSTKAGLGQTEKESPSRQGENRILKTPEWQLNTQLFLLFVLKRSKSTLSALKRGRDLPPGLRDSNTLEGFLPLLSNVLCSHEMVIHSGLWKCANKWQRFCASAIYLPRPLAIFSLTLNVGKPITVGLIFTFQVPSQILTSLCTISSWWTHAPQFWASSNDPEGKHWRNLRWD